MDESSLIGAGLKADDLELTLGETPVLKGLSLTVRKGEVVAIMGRSGSGKTSLLRSLSLFERPQRGSIAVGNRSILREGNLLIDPRIHRQSVCMVFQQYSLFPNMTGLENIVFAYRKRTGASTSEAENQARELAATFDLKDSVLSRYPQTYSGGQSQRVALLRALILEPQILLLDEVTSALDPESIVSVIEAITRLRETTRSQGLSVILVTHLTHFAAEVADRIAFLENGNIAVDLPAPKFVQSDHPGVSSFVRKFSQAF